MAPVARGQTTPASTPGSFSPATGRTSRVEPDIVEPAAAGDWGNVLDELDALAADEATTGPDLLRAMDTQLGGLSHPDDRGEGIVAKNAAGNWVPMFDEDEAARYDRLMETVFARYGDGDPYELALDLYNERAGIAP